MLLQLTNPPTRNQQVLQVSMRLAQLGYLPAAQVGQTAYDAGVAAAVKQFQLAIGILGDGKVGPQTLTALVLAAEVKRDSSQAITVRSGMDRAFAMAIARQDSGLQPGASAPGARGIFLLSTGFAGNVAVTLNTGAQTDVAVQTAITGILSQWAAGLRALDGIKQLVLGMISAGLGEARFPSQATVFRLIALGHRMGANVACTQSILARAEVRAAAYAWPAIVKVTSASIDPACQQGFVAAVGNGYVDRVMSSAAQIARAVGQSTSRFTEDGLAAVPPPAAALWADIGQAAATAAAAAVPGAAAPGAALQTIAQQAATAAAQALPAAAMPTSPPTPAPVASGPAQAFERPPAAASLPPELAPGPGEKLPVTAAAAATPAAVPGGPQAPAGDGGGGGLLLAAAIGLGLLAAS